MNELHLFAGAGGGILGGMLLGHTPVCAVEIEPYCRRVLLQRQRDGILPKFPIWILADAANSFGWFAPQVQALKFSQKGSSRRQFNRAISACSSEEAHAERLGNSDALSRDVDRLKAIGNGQVPIVAATSFRILSESVVSK